MKKCPKCKVEMELVAAREPWSDEYLICPRSQGAFFGGSPGAILGGLICGIVGFCLGHRHDSRSDDGKKSRTQMKPIDSKESAKRERFASPHDTFVNHDQALRIARRRWKRNRSKYLRRAVRQQIKQEIENE